jgi:Acylphosphatases
MRLPNYLAQYKLNIHLHGKQFLFLCIMITMQRFYRVHGIVQGVGYRSFVKSVADRIGVHGSVKNAEDGSVEIFADASLSKLERFEKEINVSIQNSIQVFSIESYEVGTSALPKRRNVPEHFEIEH